jgi:hypothetical protein
LLDNSNELYLTEDNEKMKSNPSKYNETDITFLIVNCVNLLFLVLGNIYDTEGPDRYLSAFAAIGLFVFWIVIFIFYLLSKSWKGASLIIGNWFLFLIASMLFGPSLYSFLLVYIIVLAMSITYLVKTNKG